MGRILIIFAAVLLGSISNSAQACVWIAATEFPRELSPAERHARDRHWSYAQTRSLRRQALQRDASTTVDKGAELAELLVPNVRAVTLEYSDCGPEGEIDLAGTKLGSDENLKEIFADSRISNLDPKNYVGSVRNSSQRSEFGRACNYEFRKYFSSYLANKLNKNQLSDLWIFLISHQRENGNFGSVYHRLMAFDSGTRHPPVHWQGADKWIQKDLTKFVRMTSAGRSLNAALAEFWDEQKSRLGDDVLVCPKARKQADIDKQQLVTDILIEANARRSLGLRPR